jgi:MoaA/NifB/PqqE/SkfB family radical SAM enzyme
MPKHFCPIPFHHIAMRPNGQVYPCCYFRWEETPAEFNLSYTDVFHHPFLEKIRSKLRKDEPVEGCSRCYKNEELTGNSMRTEYLEASYLGFNSSPPDDAKLTYLDLALSNVCNNRCRMCGPELSTSWYSDAKKMGIPIKSGVLEHEYNLDNFDLTNLTYIKLIGGEPLMEQTRFIELLNKCTLENLTLLITTNATVRPNDELLAIFKKCRKVKWLLSIDAFGTLNDFLRKGSNWNEVDNNLKWYVDTFPNNVNVHSVVSIYNINCLDQLYNHIRQHYPSVRQKYVMIDGPKWMHPSNLPIDVKTLVKNKIVSFNLENVEIILNDLDLEGNTTSFITQDQQLNELRNEHWKESNPELYNLLKGFYE